VVRYLKTSYPHYSCALLTNGTLFYLPEVGNDSLSFDLVLPNLDAVSAKVFARINRPHRHLESNRIIEGLAAFRKEYKGTIWLEIFIVPGSNDSTEELNLLKEAAQKIHPDRIQLNTLDRPGACDWVRPATTKQLHAIARAFAPLPVEIITRQAVDHPLWESADVSLESIRSLIVRRPSTIEEIAGLAGLTINEAAAMLSTLVASKAIVPYTVGNRTFYKIS
jgi:wyosine [tRNA(Phe)-imidazoG37] synthetase (radical SAM superfamily)